MTFDGACYFFVDFKFINQFFCGVSIAIESRIFLKLIDKFRLKTEFKGHGNCLTIFYF